MRQQSPKPHLSPSPMRLTRYQANAAAAAAAATGSFNPTSGGVVTTPTKLSTHATSNSENIQVMIRVRKLNETQKGLQAQAHQSWDPFIVEDASIQIKYSADFKASTYSFDSVANQHHDNQYIFDSVGSSVANYCMQGFNACIFAYGQTGAGKTHTMTGNASDPGLQPRVLEYLFNQLQRRVDAKELTTFRMSVSYFEIYNEQINDLISNRKDVKIRENFEGPFIENLTVLPVSTFQEAQLHFLNSTKNRSIASTLMNKQSSRSHSIFTVNIMMEDKYMNELTSKLNFVDMAGSERQKKTQSEGQRLKEAGSINKSLFEFSKVIADLAKQKQAIVFRNSKLTHILKDCLVGNSRTWVICAVNPSLLYLDETENTLKFASNAKFIQTKPLQNTVANAAKATIDELQEKLKFAQIQVDALNKVLETKQTIVDQQQVHADSQEEQMQQYYESQLTELEAEKQTQIALINRDLTQIQQDHIQTQKSLQQSEATNRELKQLVDSQEIQLKEHLNRIHKLLEEKKELVLENARLQLRSRVSNNSSNGVAASLGMAASSIDSTPTPQQSQQPQPNSSYLLNKHQETPTPQSVSFQEEQQEKQQQAALDLSETCMRLEVEVSVLRNQNDYNKTVQRELESLNSLLQTKNMDLLVNWSNIQREKESLLQEMQRMNSSSGQKSQLLTNEIDSYKNQVTNLNSLLESERVFVTELEEELTDLRRREAELEKQVKELQQEKETKEDTKNSVENKEAKVQVYLQQIHALVSELKKREEHVRIFQEEQANARLKQQQIQEISLSILKELNSSNTSCSIEEITQNEFYVNNKHNAKPTNQQIHENKIISVNSSRDPLVQSIQRKCHELSLLSSEIVFTSHVSLPIRTLQSTAQNSQLTTVSVQVEQQQHQQQQQEQKQQQQEQHDQQEQQKELKQIDTQVENVQIEKQSPKQSAGGEQLIQNEKNSHIQKQLEIFFMENPNFYVNKKRLNCFEKFIRYVFTSLSGSTTTSSTNNNTITSTPRLPSTSSMVEEQQSQQPQQQSSHNIQNTPSLVHQNTTNSSSTQQQLPTGVPPSTPSVGTSPSALAVLSRRVKSFMEQANYDMLEFQFKELLNTDRSKLSRRYETLKTLLFDLSASSNQQRFHADDESFKQQYSEYVDMYADANAVHQIQLLLFEEYNQIHLRKSKRSPCTKIPSMNERATPQKQISQSIQDSKGSPAIKKKFKSNDDA